MGRLKGDYMLELPKAQDTNDVKMLEMSTMDNQQVTISELAWLAGIWDGEGTISIRRNVKINQFSPRVHMVNTNSHMIEKVVEILRKIGVEPYVREVSRGTFEGSRKQMWAVGVDTLSKSKIILDSFFPYLVAKKPQAKLLLQFVNSRLTRFDRRKSNWSKSYLKEDIEAIKKIYLLNGNQRGTSETIRHPSMCD